MVRCQNGHYYDNAKYHACPYCGMSDDALQKTVARISEDQVKKAVEPAQQATIAKSVKVNSGIEYVVGWLVCVEGPEKGKDYRLHSERNFIGRAPEMDVSIQKDNAISRLNHAVISYNDRAKTFRLSSGEVRGIIYLNSEEVSMPTELKSGDIIEIGESSLRFVPLCGTDFSWEKKNESADV